MALECFFFDQGGPLLCDSIKRDGEVIRAHVVNGAWTLNYKPGRLRAYAGSNLVTEHAANLVRTVKIPPDMSGDYNKLITWAEAQEFYRERET
jgi:hypothetical protein